MEKEEIINEVVSIIEQQEKMDIVDLSQTLSIDQKKLQAAISRSPDLVITSKGDVQSRKWYQEKRSYMDKVIDNIINKIK